MHPSPTGPAKKPTPWLGIVALAIGIFSCITLEQLPIGVLSLVSEHYAAAESTVGFGVTLTGVIAAVTSLLTPLAIGRTDRRLIVTLALALATVSAVGSAMSPSIEWWLASRVVAGLAIGVIFAVIPIVISGFSTPATLARNTTLVFAGVGSAVVLGIPFVTWLGATLDWHWSFVVVGGLTAAMAVLVAIFVPGTTTDERVRLGDMARALRDPAVIFGLTVTTTLITGQYIAYSYVSPLLQQLAGISVADVAGLLLVFGVVALCSNFGVGPVMKRSPAGVLFVIALLLTLSVLGLSLLVSSFVSALFVMAFWGFAEGGVSVAVQNWQLTAPAPIDREPALALNAAAFNLSIALGAWFGGLAYTAGGVHSVLGWALVPLAAGLLTTVGWLVKHPRGRERELGRGRPRSPSPRRGTGGA